MKTNNLRLSLAAVLGALLPFQAVPYAPTRASYWPTARPKRKAQRPRAGWGGATLHRQHGEREKARRVRQRGDGVFLAQHIETTQPCYLRIAGGSRFATPVDDSLRQGSTEFPVGRFFVGKKISPPAMLHFSGRGAGKGRGHV